MGKAMLMLCVVLMSGCSYLAPITKKGADAYDDVRMGAEFTLCRGISIGAWVRAYGADKEKAKAWRQICQEAMAALPVETE